MESKAWIAKHGLKAQGKKELLAFLSGKPLTLLSSMEMHSAHQSARMARITCVGNALMDGVKYGGIA